MGLQTENRTAALHQRTVPRGSETGNLILGPFSKAVLVITDLGPEQHVGEPKKRRFCSFLLFPRRGYRFLVIKDTNGDLKIDKTEKGFKWPFPLWTKGYFLNLHSILKRKWTKEQLFKRSFLRPAFLLLAGAGHLWGVVLIGWFSRISNTSNLWASGYNSLTCMVNIAPDKWWAVSGL